MTAPGMSRSQWVQQERRNMESSTVRSEEGVIGRPSNHCHKQSSRKKNKPLNLVGLSALCLCLVVHLPVVEIDAWSSRYQSSRTAYAALSAPANRPSNNDATPPLERFPERRDILKGGAILLGAIPMVTSPTPAAVAAIVAGAAPTSIISIEEIAALLHSTPTFCLVDPSGVPYMVFGEDAKVTGYFFTSFGEAQRVLQLARKSADQAIRRAKREGDDDVGENPWTKARISTVPLDTAVTLVYKSGRREGIYFKVAAAVDDIQDALQVSGQDDLAEGKVPLFYYENFSDSNGKSPLYLRKQELEQAWKKAHSTKGEERPKLMVTELFSVLGQLVQPTTGNAKEDDELRNLVLLPPKESEAKAKECVKKSGNAPPFVIGQRIIVL